MSNIHDYYEELGLLNDQLQDVACRIDDLLQTQKKLLEKKSQLQRIIKQHSSNAVADVNDDDRWDRRDFSWSDDLANKQVSVFHVNSLRPMQLETMNVTLSGHDCILIMPTGGGKSLCFQLPALVSKGVTLVVSPLVSLMEDQLYALRSLDISAAILNASSNKQQVNDIQAAMLDVGSDLKLLYVTPEKLAKSKRFMSKLEKMYNLGRFGRLVIDEVHCCSQWGHDFRPDYKFLGVMKRQFPRTPILGLTATATANVIDDVTKILNIPDSILFKASFNRPNLFYEVQPKSSNHKEVMEQIKSLVDTKFPQQSGIIYCFSKKDCAVVTCDLQSMGIRAACYHADLTADERSCVHREWIRGKIKVVVATVAFGMGIDKPDVRFVIHHSLSKSMENLYQESGRAGRDDQPARCITLYRLADVFRQSCMVFAEKTGVENLYGILKYCTDLKRCRRSMVARHFGEVWQASDCNKMCDHCANNGNDDVVERDVTEYVSDVIKIMDRAAELDIRITSLKLLEAWQGKAGPKMHLPGVKAPNLTPTECERVVAEMLLREIIKEDYHFTPYSTISYLVTDRKANEIRRRQRKISLDFINKTGPEKAKAKVNEQSVSKANYVKTNPPLKQNDRPNTKKNTGRTATRSGNGTATPGKGNLDPEKLKVKRKRFNVVDPGDNEMCLAFDCEDDVVDKRYKHSGNQGRRQGAIDTGETLDKEDDCIVLWDSRGSL